LINHGT